MFNDAAFKIALIKRDKTVVDVSIDAGIPLSTLHRKRSGDSEFSIGDMLAICESLQLSDEERDEIFLSE